jgi:hypothetical protein
VLCPSPAEEDRRVLNFEALEAAERASLVPSDAHRVRRLAVNWTSSSLAF